MDLSKSQIEKRLLLKVVMDRIIEIPGIERFERELAEVGNEIENLIDYGDI